MAPTQPTDHPRAALIMVLLAILAAAAVVTVFAWRVCNVAVLDAVSVVGVGVAIVAVGATLVLRSRQKTTS